MHVKARMLLQPCPHSRMFVCGVVVRDEMEFLCFGCFPINAAQKFQPLDICVSGLALANHLAVQNIEGREQCCRAIAFVIMCHRLRTSFFSAASPVESDPAPVSGSSRRSTAPARVRVGTGTTPQCLRVSRRTSDHAKP